MPSPLQRMDKEEFLRLIRSGYTEPKAMAAVNVDPGLLPLLLVKDSKFREDLEEAKKARADVFYEKIVDSVDTPLEKDEVPAAKLRVDTLKYLASIDNPDKYSEKVKHQHDINVNIFQEIKDLPQHEAKRLIAEADPFLTADFSVVEEDEGDLL